jgi:hypothetical protein
MFPCYFDEEELIDDFLDEDMQEDFTNFTTSEFVEV